MIIGLENHYGLLFEWPLKTGFTVYSWIKFKIVHYKWVTTARVSFTQTLSMCNIIFLLVRKITRIPKSDVSLAKTEEKQGKFVKFISRAKGYFRETSKSQTINPISPTPKVSLGIIQIKIR